LESLFNFKIKKDHSLRIEDLIELVNKETGNILEKSDFKKDIILKKENDWREIYDD
jgi:hypothetical protein